MAIDIIAAMTTKPNRIDYLLPGLVAGTVGALVSPGGTGKSAFALQLCAQVAGGRDTLGLGSLPKGKAIYLAAEDPEIIILHRLFALGELCNSTERDPLQDRLIIEPLLKDHPDILKDDWHLRIKTMAADARLICIDTLRMFHSGQENDSGAMTEVVARMKRICAETGATILFLHHVNKFSGLTGQGAEQQASRGSSVLVDNVRWQGYMVNMSEAEARDLGIAENRCGYYVRFGVSKHNYGRPCAPIWYEKISCSDVEVEAGYTLQPVRLDAKGKARKGRKNVASY